MWLKQVWVLAWCFLAAVQLKHEAAPLYKLKDKKVKPLPMPDSLHCLQVLLGKSRQTAAFNTVNTHDAGMIEVLAFFHQIGES